MDLGSTDEFSTLGSSFKNFDKGHIGFDVPHRFVYSYIYEMPFGRGKRFGGSVNPIANTILGGRQVSSIWTFSKGSSAVPPREWTG